MRTFKNIVTVMAVLSMTAFAAISCGKKESQTPAAGVDTTMTQTMPESTGTAGVDTTQSNTGADTTKAQ